MLNNPKLIDQSCPVRPCVIEKGFEHCAQCEQYICEKLTERFVAYEEVQHRVDAEISEEDYLCFIRPYENKKRLDQIRDSGEDKRE